jgi:dynein heavy chain 1
LFHDRLVSQRERDYTSAYIDEVAKTRFPNIDLDAALKRPILLSNWLSQNYESVTNEDLRSHIQNRLRQFQEEELDVKLVMYDEALDHVLRIDRVLRQVKKKNQINLKEVVFYFWKFRYLAQFRHVFK